MLPRRLPLYSIVRLHEHISIRVDEMKITDLASVLLIAGLSFTKPVWAQAPQATDEQVLKRLSIDWMNAIERKDKQTLEAILSSDYVLQMPGDLESQYTHRGEWIKNSINKDWSDFRYENFRIRVNGHHATVSSILHFRIAPIPFSIATPVVDTWERRGASWQVTTRYLGTSDLEKRIAFIFGLFAAGLIACVAYVIAKLARRAGKRAV